MIWALQPGSRLREARRKGGKGNERRTELKEEPAAAARGRERRQEEERSLISSGWYRARDRNRTAKRTNGSERFSPVLTLKNLTCIALLLDKTKIFPLR